MLHVPQTLRALVRADELWLVILAAVLGLFAGLCVTAMTDITQGMHRLLFALGPDERLSGQVNIAGWRGGSCQGSRSVAASCSCTASARTGWRCWSAPSCFM